MSGFHTSTSSESYMSVRECLKLSLPVSPAVRWGWLYISLPGSYKLQITGHWPFWSQVSTPLEFVSPSQTRVYTSAV